MSNQWPCQDSNPDPNLCSMVCQCSPPAHSSSVRVLRLSRVLVRWTQQGGLPWWHASPLKSTTGLSPLQEWPGWMTTTLHLTQVVNFAKHVVTYGQLRVTGHTGPWGRKTAPLFPSYCCMEVRSARATIGVVAKFFGWFQIGLSWDWTVCSFLRFVGRRLLGPMSSWTTL